MKTFNRRKENFVCEHCGAEIEGNGYTNHCPKCLWSKHVDINPGDRAETCCGMMKPVAIEVVRGGYIITHKCEKCGAERRNKTSSDDDFEMILALAKEQTNQLKG